MPQSYEQELTMRTLSLSSRHISEQRLLFWIGKYVKNSIVSLFCSSEVCMKLSLASLDFQVMNNLTVQTAKSDRECLAQALAFIWEQKHNAFLINNSWRGLSNETEWWRASRWEIRQFLNKQECFNSWSHASPRIHRNISPSTRRHSAIIAWWNSMVKLDYEQLNTC